MPPTPTGSYNGLEWTRRLLRSIAGIGMLATLCVLAFLGSPGCEQNLPPHIALDDVVSVEVGATVVVHSDQTSLAVNDLVAAYNAASTASFNTETTPENVVTLHFRNGDVVQIQFSPLFPPDCVLVFVSSGDDQHGTFYMLKSRGLLAAARGLGAGAILP